MRVLFFRKFLSDFIDELGKVDPTLVSPQARQLIADSRKPEQIEEIRKGFMQMGLSINSESKGPLGICAVSSDGTMVKGCCRLIVEEMEGGLIIP